VGSTAGDPLLEIKSTKSDTYPASMKKLRHDCVTDFISAASTGSIAGIFFA
jgi:hypothetical protein